MSHAIDFSNNRANIAFTGSRKDVWHRLGTEMPAGATVEQWKAAAGLEWSTVPTQAFHQLPDGRFEPVAGWSYQTRNDTLQPLGYTSNASYKPVQPGDLLDTLAQYTSVDERFALDVAGSLDGGKRIWATATYNGTIQVGGSDHTARLLATTSFDGTMATWLMGCMTRVICNNTLRAALGEKAPVIRTRHSRHFDKVAAGKELSDVIAGFEQFKAMGDAMAQVALTNGDVSAFFKKILGIPKDAQKDDLSTRKMNQFQDLSAAYSATVNEGTQKGTVWTALNAVTRYVDHDRSSRNGDSAESARFQSAQFGSGQAMKQQAVALLFPLVKDLVAA